MKKIIAIIILFGLLSSCTVKNTPANEAVEPLNPDNLISKEQESIIKENGIDLMKTIELNGVPQVIHIRGQNKSNPVILRIHGGPGYSSMLDSYPYQVQWENDFTVVNWDQRNTGKTFFS